jgi:hypothetical protein
MLQTNDSDIRVWDNIKEEIFCAARYGMRIRLSSIFFDERTATNRPSWNSSRGPAEKFSRTEVFLCGAAFAR